MTEKDLDVAIEMCERIMEFDTRTMKDPVSENGFLFDSVYDLLNFLRQFQIATDTNVGGNLIDRQAVIDAVDGVPWYYQNKNGEMVHGANSDEHQAWYKAEDLYKAIESVPSAQPEYTEQDVRDAFNDGYRCGMESAQPTQTNTSNALKSLDCISRQAAIETVRKAKDKSEAYRMLIQLPSAKPEHLHTVMKKINEQYEKAVETQYIMNPMAWALYQVWKEYDKQDEN